MQRIHVIYTGNVQGVGFRFTAERIAVNLDLTGFVKNCHDGTVEVVCEGKKTELETFLSNIKKYMAGYISDTRIDWQEASNEFSSFEIKF